MVEKRNGDGQFHGSGTATNERGCTHRDNRDSLSLSPCFSFRSTRDSNLTRLHSLPSNSIVSSFRSRDLSFVLLVSSTPSSETGNFARSLVRSVGALQWLAGNSAKQILRTRNWLDPISGGRRLDSEQLSSSSEGKGLLVSGLRRHLCLSIKSTRSPGPTPRSLSPNPLSPQLFSLSTLDQFTLPSLSPSPLCSSFLPRRYPLTRPAFTLSPTLFPSIFLSRASRIATRLRCTRVATSSIEHGFSSTRLGFEKWMENRAKKKIIYFVGSRDELNEENTF